MIVDAETRMEMRFSASTNYAGHLNYAEQCRMRYFLHANNTLSVS